MLDSRAGIYALNGRLAVLHLSVRPGLHPMCPRGHLQVQHEPLLWLIKAAILSRYPGR